jgi:uncharacterized protein YjbI with pentapeptide repeats
MTGIRILALALVLAAAPPFGASAQMAGLDMGSPKMTQATMTRAEVEARLAQATPDAPADFTLVSLNGLDLSGLDFSKAVMRSAYLNGADLSGARLDGAVLDQAWALKADFSGASLKGASLFQAQMMDTKFDGADLSGARLTADFSRASMLGANFAGANFSADMRNQSMGMMRGVLNSAKLQGARFDQADLSRAQAKFADFRGASLVGGNLAKMEAQGANFTGADVSGADFDGMMIQSAVLADLKGDPKNRDKAKLR